MTNQELCHRFFYSEKRYQAPARMSIRFDGDDFYSYGTIIAQITTGLDGNRYTLVSDHSMSPTTGKHISYVKLASPHPVILVPMRYGVSHFDVSVIENRLVEDLEYLASQKMTQKANREAYSRAFEELETANRLLIKIKKTILNKYRRLYDRINDPERIAEEKHRSREAAAKRHKKLRAELGDLIESYNVAELARIAYAPSGSHPADVRSKLKKYLNPTGEMAFVWKDGNTYRTSKGVTVSEEEVNRVARIFRAGGLKHGDKLSFYTVLGITEKYIRIGCHVIPMENIRCIVN